MQLVDDAEARRDDGGELLEQRARRLGNLEIVEALLLHSLASGRAGHALDGEAAKLVAAGEAIDELRRDCARAEDDELGRTAGDSVRV